MSDKYYLHDCNSYTHSCQNTYRIDHKDSLSKLDARDELEKNQTKLTWWQLLRKKEVQAQEAKV